MQRSRRETEALAGNFKITVAHQLTPVEIGGLRAEWITPSGASADRVILFFHGGSYNSGSIASHRSLAANLAHAAGARILCVDYRLAPEHPFPAAVEDALSAYRWLLRNHVRPERIVLAGDSCGGGLALALLVALRDGREPLPAAAAGLSPWTDLTCTGDAWDSNAKKDIVLEPRGLRESAQLYLGQADPRTPLASPLFADLRGLPPLLIQAASDEILLSDSTEFAARAREAGVDVTLEVWDGMQHEWHFAAQYAPEARQAIEHIGRFVRERLGGREASPE